MSTRYLFAAMTVLLWGAITPSPAAQPTKTETPAAAKTAGGAPQASDWLAVGHERFNQRDFAGARAEYAKIAGETTAPAALRSLALICTAQTFDREGDLAKAKVEYAKLVEMEEAPRHHRWEAEERIRELTRRQNGLAPRDPAATRKKISPAPRPAVTLHVAPTGNDANAGTAEQPFGSLERARDEIRALKKRGPLPSGGVAVAVRGGEYRVHKTLRLEASDSGTETAPVVYRAADGETPRFRGGIRLKQFRTISDPAILARLPEEARGKVIEVDLKSIGITNLLPLKLGGFASGNGFKTHPAHELFFDGKALQLACGPNEGFLRIKDVAVKDGTKGYDRQGSKVGKFFYEGDRPSRWADEPELLLYGYWFWDWADSYERVASIDTAARQITLAPPVHNYGFSVGAPFYALNALCELDAPGEWYLDRASGKLFFYPPSDPTKATVEFSLFPEAMMRMENVSHVRLQGISWELGSADAIHIQGGTNGLIAGCTVRQFAGNGIEIHGGSGHGLLSCNIHSLGRGGTIVSGGDRKTLTPGGHFVENCHIYDLSRIDHTYTPAIVLNGVGNRVAHNRMHGIGSSAMRVGGNDHLIEFNEVFNVVLESDDQGGADMWGNATYRGNVYRFNYWHHIGNWRGTGEAPKCGQAGIRLDDAISGTLIYGNIFYRTSAGKLGFGGVQIHGGKDNVIDNNVFADCAAMVSFSAWGDQRWQDFVKHAMEDTGIDKSLYLRRYPELLRLMENANANSIWRNVGFRCGEIIRRNSRRSELIDNGNAQQGLDRSTGRVDRPGFAPIPFEEIGLYRDAVRGDVPVVSFKD